MAIFKREEELFKEWEIRTPFVRDGAVSEHDYLKSCPRIAFILKEANDPGDPFDIRQFLQNRNGGKGYTWNNVARWVHGIRNLPSECDWSCYENVDARFRREELRGIATMNMKKSPGGSSTRNSELKSVTRDDAEFIQKQYAIYDPDITICGGVGELFRQEVYPNMSWNQTTHGVRWYWRKAHKCIVEFYHPAARFGTARLLRDLLDAVKEIKGIQK